MSECSDWLSGRRALLKAGVAAGSLFLPSPFAWVWAQSEGTLKLLRAPKMALVMGNSKYKESPLKNPANDARAIGDALKAAGFDVTLRLDARRDEMAAAVQAYVKVLAGKKAVGLFYFAGHGLQLAWRNYMLPVDMDIDTVADVPKQGVEVNALLEGLAKAENPMNMIILDACRDNPFGHVKGVDHKGLSQMDAPNHTLLAYATNPGNVASDGEGENGLYTESFLREMKVKDAKIEEVFKRVRLNVRLKSKGAQVPWESTSLEEDFWFQPPAELKKLSDAEKIRLLDEEAAVWDKARATKEAKLIEAYLQRYPTGSFSEIAQLELDRALAKAGEKKVEIINEAANPFTKGSVTTNTAYKVGDSYTTRAVDRFSRVEASRRVSTVTEIVDDEVRFDDGQVFDLLGNRIRFPDGRVVRGFQTQPFEYAVGKRWTSRFVIAFPNGQRGTSEAECAIVAREKVVVPAGSFDAYRVQFRTLASTPNGVVDTRTVSWRAPADVRYTVAQDETRLLQGKTIFDRRIELVAYQQG